MSWRNDINKLEELTNKNSSIEKKKTIPTREESNINYLKF